MKKIITICALLFAGTSISSAQENVDSLTQKIDSLEQALDYITAKEELLKETERINKIWKQKKIINIGYMDQTLKNTDADTELKSKYACFLQFGRTIYLHKKPIANVLKFGVDLLSDISYANYGDIYDEENNKYNDFDDSYGDFPEMDFGQHQASVGIGVGPSVTYAPFANLTSGIAHLKVNTYFRLTPSYSAIIISSDDETELNSAFCLYKNWGIGLQWKALYAGFETRWGDAKYKMKYFGEDMFEDMNANINQKIKFKTTSSRFYIGFRF
ncbi:MAG: hypothetical protein J6R79_00600 [Bacteroidaceae bacterium]|nr:hypothetical protein [Bacteroidaceae bacterium]